MIPVYYNAGLIFPVLAVVFIGHDNIVVIIVIAEIRKHDDIATRSTGGKKLERSDNQTGCKQQFSQII